MGKTLGPFVFQKTIGPFTETVDLDLELSIDWLEFATTYRLGQWPIGSAGKEWSLGLLAGARWTKIEATLSFNEQSASLEEDWIDPFVGVRLDVDLSPKWDLFASADFGGFGVGADFTWNAWAMLGYQWQENKRLSFGFRGMYQDYEEGSGSNRFKWDETMYGPVLELEIAF